MTNHFRMSKIFLHQLGLVDFILLNQLFFFLLDFLLHFGNQILLNGKKAFDVVKDVLRGNSGVKNAHLSSRCDFILIYSTEKNFLIFHDIGLFTYFLGKVLSLFL